MIDNLTNSRVVITGITGGIATAVARQLLSKGADVVVSARTEEKLEQAMSSLPGKVSGYVLDVTDVVSIQRFFQNVGQFDHLVTPAASSMFAPIKDMDFDAARQMIETKQWGQMSCVHYALPYLSEQGSVTLFSGTVTQKPLPGATMFAAAGAATEAAGRIWAYELAPIRVNTIVPGVIATDVWSELTGSDQAASDQLAAIGKSLPVKRVGTADEVADAVLFVINNAFVNGISLVVDGGHRLV